MSHCWVHKIDNATRRTRYINSSCRDVKKRGQERKRELIVHNLKYLEAVKHACKIVGDCGIKLACSWQQCLVRFRECEKFTESKVHGWDRSDLEIHGSGSILWWQWFFALFYISYVVYQRIVHFSKLTIFFFEIVDIDIIGGIVTLSLYIASFFFFLFFPSFSLSLSLSLLFYFLLG